MKKNQLFKPLTFLVISAVMIISCKKNMTHEDLPSPQGKTASNRKIPSMDQSQPLQLHFKHRLQQKWLRKKK